MANNISLHLIVKDEVELVQNIILNAKSNVVKCYITVSDVDAYKKLLELEDKSVKVDYRQWNDRFDEARQHNWDLGKNHDYSMWLDADDTFDFSQLDSIIAQSEDKDCIFLPYDYDHDENGEVIVRLWRERIVKRSAGFYWKGWVHENLISQKPFSVIRIDVPVTHAQTQEHKDESLVRNHAILLKAYLETKDPRYIHYLGISYFSMKNFESAIETLNKYLEVGEWTEEIYRSLVKISESYYLLKNIEMAILFALKAVAVNNKLPQAYHLLCHYEYEDKDYEAAILYANDALSRGTPEDSSIWDPTAVERTYLTMAMCHYEAKDYKNAYKMLQKVHQVDVSDILPEFKYKAEVEVFKDILPGLKKFYNDPSTLWSGLNDDLKFDSTMRDFKNEVTKPHIWADKTIVFFCGKAFEEWGPHTLEDGMGGSEEAVVYLTKELAKQGFTVFVYGEVPSEYFIDNVYWIPWNRFDPRDTFDTLVIWRQPQIAGQFKANKIFIDMHDALPERIVTPYDNATYLFKSQYHKDLYPNVVKYHIIPNGVVAKQFSGPVVRNPYSVIYASAYYRGLEILLKLWPEVKKAVPEATLDIYYGWESWVNAEGKDAFYERMTKKLKDMEQYDVIEHGRVDHTELAHQFMKSKVWAYPTEFNEIFCITAVKANLAGCKPVITDVAALKETGGPQASIVESDTIYRDEYVQKLFVDELIKALKETHDAQSSKLWAAKYNWSKVAKDWTRVING